MIRKVMIERYETTKSICRFVLELRKTDMSRIDELWNDPEYKTISIYYNERKNYIQRMKVQQRRITPKTIKQMWRALDMYKRNILKQ